MIRFFENVSIGDKTLAGGKGAALGDLYTNLRSQGIQVPYGYCVTTEGYDYFMDFNQLNNRIKSILTGLDVSNHVELSRRGIEIRSLIQNGQFPKELEESIINSYHKLSNLYRDTNGHIIDQVDVAVRSSGTFEDMEDASFAGQQDTYLNIRNDTQLLNGVRNCFASLFTDRAISYRVGKGITDYSSVKISVVVQKMVRSDLGSSGVAFSIDPESGFDGVVVINSSFGLGEQVVQGEVTPDEFIYSKRVNAIIDKKLGHKTTKMVYDNSSLASNTSVVHIEKSDQLQYSLTDSQITQLAEWVILISKYYGRPMDIEWALDCENKESPELYIVQARPETIHSNRSTGTITRYTINNTSKYEKLLDGIAVGDKVSHGIVRVLHSLDGRSGANCGAENFNPGDILVTDMTDPNWEPVMKIASAIITNRGGRVCHAAIIAREHGIPAIVGSNVATEVLKTGMEITVSCAEGERGVVYNGTVPFKKTHIDVDSLPVTKTKIMFNVGSPGNAFKAAILAGQKHNNGVGLARLEFIINNFIGIHPLALLNYDDLYNLQGTEELSLNERNRIINAINEKTAHYDTKKDYFVTQMSYGIAKIAAAFYPKPVIVRYSDFKSNEYRELLGGPLFEPNEENPMIGWRGASRYYSDIYKEAFGLECQAVKKVREEMGLDNVIVMIPFCRTVEECIKVQECMKENGLVRGQNGLKVYLMCEIPANVILADEFCKYVDGYSIGSNDLTQLTLGNDRDSSLVAHVFNELDPAVLKMMEMAIDACKRNGKKVGICGQGPSDYPELAEFLVEKGIDSMSIVPDSLIKTTTAVHSIEQKRVSNQSEEIL